MSDTLRAKAEAIVRRLMGYDADEPLSLIDQHGRDHQGSWSPRGLVDRIHKHLLEMEEERKS